MRRALPRAPHSDVANISRSHTLVQQQIDALNMTNSDFARVRTQAHASAYEEG